MSFNSFSQEKRIALVIGNAKYENAPVLNNPVNDALLMKETFDKLGFDVIIETDIETRDEFVKVIDEYNERRKNYTVGFVYYAGHAVQIEGINYMLATKESYESASHVKYKGLDIDIFTDQFRDPYSNEVNVLILDACRNNPFEKKIYGGTRSIENGLGLAEIKNPPMGSLIAFSTEKGMTAKDQIEKSKNSFYCQSLSRNMLLEGVNLRNVFGRVCREVFTETKQYPEVYDKLMDIDFYLKKNTYTDQIIQIDSLIESQNFISAITKTSGVLSLDPTNKQALLRMAEAQFLQFKSNYNGFELKKALSLYPQDPEVFLYMAKFEIAKGKRSKAIPHLRKCLEFDTTFAESYFLQSNILSTSYQRLELINKALLFQPNNEKYILERASIYQEMGDFQNAKRDCFHIFTKDSSNIDAIISLGSIYESEGRFDDAISIFDKGIEQYQKNPKRAAYCYINKGFVLSKMGNISESIKNFNSAIQINPKNGDFYKARGDYFFYHLNNYSKAIEDYTHAIQLDSTVISYWATRAMVYWTIGKKEEAVTDLNHAYLIDPNDLISISLSATSYFISGMNEFAFQLLQDVMNDPNMNSADKAIYYPVRGTFYQDLKDYKNAEIDFTKAIKINPKIAENYQNRADLYYLIEEYDKALRDLNVAIQLSPNNYIYLYNRADLYYHGFNDSLNAISDLKKILSISPSNVDAINFLGNIYEDFGRIDLAIASYELGIALEGTAPFSAAYCYQNRGNIYAELGENDKAKADFDKAVMINPNNKDHYRSRGDFYSDYLKQERLAIIDYSKAIELDSVDSFSWLCRSYAKEFIDEEGTLNDALQAYMLDTNSNEVINFLSRIYVKKGYLDSASNLLNRAISKKGASADLLSESYELLGDLESDKSNYYDAINNYTESINIFPDFASSAYLKRSNIFSRLDDKKAQFKDLNKALAIENKDPTFLAYRGLLYGTLGEFEKAETDFKEAYIKDDSTTSVFLIEAKYLKNKKDYLNALNRLDTAIKIDPKDPESYFYKALIFEELNKIPQSVHYYTLAHQLLIEKRNYFVYDDHQNLMHISEVFNRIGMFYEKIGEYNLMCDEFSRSLEYLKTDQILRLTEMKERMKFRISKHCK